MGLELDLAGRGKEKKMRNGYLLEERLYKAEDGEIVREGDTRAASVYRGVGQRIPMEEAVELGLVGGEETAEPEKPAEEASDSEEQAQATEETAEPEKPAEEASDSEEPPPAPKKPAAKKAPKPKAKKPKAKKKPAAKKQKSS